MDLRDLINNPSSTIVDVRTPYEFMGGKVEGSINIPLDEVSTRVEEFKSMGGNIILCCLSGNRSGMAASFLAAQGVENVYNAGGWMDVNFVKSKAA